jgi:hypothetical protein
MLKSALGSASDKNDYITGKYGRAHYYQAMDALLQRAGGSDKHAVGDKPTFAGVLAGRGAQMIWQALAVLQLWLCCS